MVQIYGTLGPSCSDTDTIEAMFRAGMTGMRLNLSHVSLRDSRDRIRVFHEAADRCGIRPRLLVDMQGPELRIGRLAEPCDLRESGETWLGREGIPVPSQVLEALKEGHQILLDDGRILLEVLETGRDRVRTRILRGGLLSSRKSIAVIGLDLHLPAMTEADIANIRDAEEFGVTGIMQPFVRSREDLLEVRRQLKAGGAGNLTLVAKIENLQGVRSLPNLLPVTDEICIARGDLGNAMDLWDLPAAQKKIAAACRAAGVPFMVATQMLTSMEKSAVPTRAEVSDIFNTVLDGAAGVMITGESAVGRYPVEAIRYLANTARAGEAWRTRREGGKKR